MAIGFGPFLHAKKNSLIFDLLTTMVVEENASES